MKTLVVGATGYLGSAIARNLNLHGAETYGLARSPEKSAQLTAAGVRPFDGGLDDIGQRKALVEPFDVIVLAAAMPFDLEYEVVSSLVDLCRGSRRHLILTSGTGVLAIDSKDGRWNENTFAEDDPFPFPASFAREARLKTEDLVRAAAADGLHTTVVRPPLLYGHGGSSQVPMIFDSVSKTGDASYIGHGLNLYSNVHVDDAADVFRLAIEKGTPGALYHAVAGEADYRSIAEAVATVSGCKAQSISYEQACEIWHPIAATMGLAVNSRSTCPRTRRELGWEPQRLDLIEDIRSGSYRDTYLETAR
ncbi:MULTISPECIES: NAD-dependent epimerase/dehydratase family protein [unclassified Mycobacterium]|uniref:NAD-dependent epimerase/dehydratase family protein n=1 Tax=unclassified Mycobacterium TaxID=2642494 RepID=UPI0029C7BEE9|nr:MULTISPECIES: NAD-dependent epimerase/dehydratase family protein [unclassified Mycobacterium]